MIKRNILLITSFLIFTFSCQGKKDEGKMILRCLIYPTGITSETYMLRVFENGRFECTFGTKSSSIEKEDFDNIVKMQSTVLKKSDLMVIEDLQSQVLKLQEVEKSYTKKGGWEIILITGEKKYHFYYGEQNETSLGKLIELLKQLSPYKIDIHSWS
jgi:hypothetical protein